MRPPPTTPRYRFPSPDDIIPRPQSGPPRFTLTTTQQAAASPAIARPEFATPAAPKARQRQQDASTLQTPTGFNSKTRGFSPDPDLFTPKPRPSVKFSDATADVTKNKRRRSFDLDEIDEALLSGKPKVLGPSSGGWKYPSEAFSATPIPGRSTQVPGNLGQAGIQATPTPAIKPRALFRHSSTILSSPPVDLNLSFGDTQEDVQEESGLDIGRDSGEPGHARRRKKRKSAGVFDDIESIASSLPDHIELGEEEDESSGIINMRRTGINDIEERDISENENKQDGENTGPKGKGNLVPRPTFKTTLKQEPLTPPKFRPNFISNFTDKDTPGPLSTAANGKQWIKVPNQPQLNLPQKSPSAKLNMAICAMAWSPSHRKRRNANSKYLTGGLASTVLGWAYDAQDSVLRNNTIIEQTPHLHRGVYTIRVEQYWEEENYVAIVGAAERQQIVDAELEEGTPVGESGAESTWQAKVILIGDENSALRKDLRGGSRVEVRPPTWDITVVEEDIWAVAINWNTKSKITTE
ncbi:hypothetical protein ABW20_dc0105005 [Dactylellina cionopaga]|nr:hypothetical protein ABW20_dc0105005 [Dactylellina cionopaga]